MPADRPPRVQPPPEGSAASTDTARRRPRPGRAAGRPPSPASGPGIAELLAGWHAFSRRMAEVRDLEGLSEALMAFVRSQMELEYAVVYLFDLVDGSLRLFQAEGFTAAERKEAERTAWVRHPGMVVRTGRVLHVPDVTRDEQELSRSSARSFTVRSRLYFPIRASSGGVGCIGLSSARKHAFGEHHATLLALTSELAGSVYQRLATEQALRGRDAMLSALARGSSALLQAREGGLALVDMLRDIGEGLCLSRVSVDAIATGKAGVQRLDTEYAWRAEGVRRRTIAVTAAMDTTPDTFRELCECLEAGKVVGGRLQELPDALRPWMELRGVRSALMAPVRVDQVLWGVASLEDHRRARVWSPHEADALLGVASTIGAMIARREDQLRLAQSEARYRAAVEEQTELVCRTDLDGTITFANGAFCRFFGFDQEDVARLQVRNPRASDLPLAPQSHRDEADGHPANAITTEEQRPDVEGQARWLQWTDRTLLDPSGRVAGCLSVGRDITEAQHAREEKDLAAARLRSALEGTAAALSQLVEQRDPYTAGHQRRVAALAAAIARSMGLDEDVVAGVTMGGLVHDLGKISVPVEILSKPSELAPVERRLIEAHAETGWQILAPLDFPWPIAEMVRQHHERMDGRGYPRGLRGEDILIEARIIAVADTVEAISSNRPYRPARGMRQALQQIETERGRGFDPAVVDACLKVLRDGGFTFPEM